MSEAAEQLVKALVERIGRYDGTMNQEGKERSPTGDDYNELMDQIALAVHQALPHVDFHALVRDWQGQNQVFDVIVTQTYTVRQSLVLKVSGADKESVLDEARDGVHDLPAWDSPHWKREWRLTDEEYA